jgi:putative membrane protein
VTEPEPAGRYAAPVGLLLRVVVNALALAAAVWLVDGVELTAGSGGRQVIALLVVAVLFGLVNAVVKPVVKVLSLPLFVLTLGLITFVINALMLWLTAGVAGLVDVPFDVDGFWPALLGGLVVTVVSWLLNVVLPDD